MERVEVPKDRYQEPLTQVDIHRPVGVPRAREIKSQKAQLESTHRHGTNKAWKIKMSKKTGLEKG